MTTLTKRIRDLPSWQVTLGVALLALGFLVAAQLRTEGPRVRYTTQERSPLVETALNLQSEQEALKTQLSQVEGQIRDVQQESAGSAQLVREVNQQLEDARIAAGLVALEGPGVVLALADSTAPIPSGANAADFRVSGDDIRTVVEELWLAGAEAIAVNGERLTPSSAIVDIGGAILVNAAYLSPPYQVSAIGPDDLFERLSESSGWQDFVRARSEGFGISLAFAEPDQVTVPAYVGTVSLPHTRPAGSEPSP
jgi:uncharacterized protein YlxW (UPF0749 family)